jgi:pyruvate dehydrogenase E2 component (dihydrolipoamide acetyltransferase)
MAHEIAMPKLGLTMTEGTIVEWVAEPGQTVQKGDPILVVETDKTNLEVGAESSGVVQQVVAAGETVAVETVVGYLLEPGEAPVADA